MKSMKQLGMILALILLGTLLLAACGTAPQNAAPDSASPEAEATAIEPEAQAPLDDTPAGEETNPPEVTEAPEAEAATEDPYPGPAEDTRPDSPPNRGSELHATDPAGVSLASGDIQLVEFFAYW